MRAGGEEERREEKAGLRQQQDIAAVIAIGNVAGGEGEQEKGRDLHQADVAQHQGGMGDQIEIPGNGHRQHL